MSFQIEFQKSEIFKQLDVGISIETALHHGNRKTNCLAKIDTGSQVCLFARDYADILEIEVETGFREKVSTLAGGLIAYAHQIELETLGLRFQSYVYFAESY